MKALFSRAIRNIVQLTRLVNCDTWSSADNCSNHTKLEAKWRQWRQTNTQMWMVANVAASSCVCPDCESLSTSISWYFRLIPNLWMLSWKHLQSLNSHYQVIFLYHKCQFASAMQLHLFQTYNNNYKKTLYYIYGM